MVASQLATNSCLYCKDQAINHVVDFCFIKIGDFGKHCIHGAGFFTDGVGFFLLFPPTRIWLVSLVASRMVVSTTIQGQARHRPDSNVIDGVKYHRDE